MITRASVVFHLNVVVGDPQVKVFIEFLANLAADYLYSCKGGNPDRTTDRSVARHQDIAERGTPGKETYVESAFFISQVKTVGFVVNYSAVSLSLTSDNITPIANQ